MSANHLIDARGRICATRAHKNAEHIKRIASHLIKDPKQGITSIIPAETLAKLHTISNPQEVIQNKELAILLEKNKFPSVRNTVSGPLFNGTLYFVQINFNTPNGAFSINNADIQTVINYSRLAIHPISHYTKQYGNNRVDVSNNNNDRTARLSYQGACKVLQ